MRADAGLNFTPETVLPSKTGRATWFFNQQRPVGPCTPRRTYVQDAQIPSVAQAASQVLQLSTLKFLKSDPGRLILSSACKDLQNHLGIDLGKTGWMIGYMNETSLDILAA